VPVLVPGLCLPKALQPFLPIFQQGLISGTAETKEQAAEGLGELIDVTSEKTLKEVVVPITGYGFCLKIGPILLLPLKCRTYGDLCCLS